MTCVNVLDHGYVGLVEHAGGDLSIVNAARTSYNNPSVELDDKDKGLINFLMREKHGTPFEMAWLMFEVQAPIFVFREWHRHRIASINEMSGRYVELPRLFYIPDRVREQRGKPGAYEYLDMEDADMDANVRATMIQASDFAFDSYEAMLKVGVAKEHARIVLPLNTYSKMVWSCNLRALFNFLSLRNHDRAQYEIRVYAEAMEEMAMSVAPIAMKAFVANGRIAP